MPRAYPLLEDSLNNVWIVDWTLIVTVFGWALVLGGASRIIAPRALLGAFLTFKVYA